MKPVTLFDRLYKASFRNEDFGWRSNAEMRDTLTRARRFILTDEMSTFLGELGTRAFVTQPKTRNRIIDNLRIGARLPHDVVWVEYNLRLCQVRSGEILEKTNFQPSEIPHREGWLITRHPHLENAFLLHIISGNDTPEERDEYGFDTWTFPISYAWVSDNETVIPWKPLIEDEPNARSELATGVMGYKTDKITICLSHMLVTQRLLNADKVGTLLREWVGVLRRCLAFFATINDLPVSVNSARPNKGGFVAKGRYRKFLDYSTIHLTVPAKRYTTVARKALADMHRRAHPVRGHWRDDWRHPYSKLCDHEFTADEHHRWCVHCKGRESWIKDHVRCDASAGFVIQQYVVNHDREKAETAR